MSKNNRQPNSLIDVTDPTIKRKRGRPKGSTILPLAVIVAELKAGKTARQIAQTYGLAPASVGQRINKAGISLVGIRAYKAHRADLALAKQSQILEAMSPDKIEKASLRDQATTINILHNMERLDRGQSTENVAYHSIASELTDIEAEIARLEGKGEDRSQA